MGYSHYWKIEEDMTVQEFKHLQSIAAKIAEASDAPVGLSINTHPLYPSITVEGMASDAHETFYLTPKAVKFEFCKTARKPYDEVVVGILDYADALGLLKFTSDGNPDDLAAGERLASVHYIAQDDEEYKANKAGDYVINWPESGAEAARDVEEEEAGTPFDTLLERFNNLENDFNKLDNLVALLSREIDRR